MVENAVGVSALGWLLEVFVRLEFQRDGCQKGGDRAASDQVPEKFVFIF